MKRVFPLAILALTFSFLLPKIIYARSGCCSHHGGVCGCGCCDGTGLSNTCAPYYPQCSQPVYVAPVPTKAPVVYTPKPATPKPTTTPIQIPTNTPSPDVQGASTESTPTPTITLTAKTEASSTGGQIITLGILGIIAYFGLKYLGRKASSSKQ